MIKLSVTETAKVLGCTRQNVNLFVTGGQLVRDPVLKKIDFGLPINFQFLNDRDIKMSEVEERLAAPKPATAKKPKKKSPKKPKKKKPPKNPPVDYGDDGSEGYDLEEVVAGFRSLDLRQLSSADVAKAARLESALKTRVDQEHKRGLLVERALVQTVLGKLYTVDSNELKTLGSRVAPIMAGIFGEDDPEMILRAEREVEKEVFKSLAHIKRILDEFLVKLGGEEVS